MTALRQRMVEELQRRTMTTRSLSVMPSSLTPSLQTFSLMQSAELHPQPLWVLDL